MARSNVVPLPSVNSTTLKERIQKYAEVWIVSGNKTEAYEAAGYSCPTPSNAYNFHKQHHESITREAAMHMASHVPLAIRTLADIMVNGKSETARVKSALEIMDRAGLDKTTKISISGQEPKSKDELQEQLLELLAKNPELNLYGEEKDDGS